MASVEGVWTVEMLGPYGWETVSTAFLHDGRYLAASLDHYTVGAYEQDGETVKVVARIARLGEARAIFGSTEKHVDTHMEGTFENADQIVGTASATGNVGFDIKLRLSRLGGLD